MSPALNKYAKRGRE